MPPFVIFCLPRSRSAWLSAFLSYGGWCCGHDQIRYFRGLLDIPAWLSQPYTGTVETAGAPFWRTLMATRPDAKVVVIRRPVADVVDSLMRLNLGLDRARVTVAMQRLDHKLDQIEKRVPGSLSVSYDDLATEAGCRRVFEHCLPYPHDHQWWAAMAPRNVQINVAATMRYFAAHQSLLGKLAEQVKCRTLASFSQRPSRDLDGLVIAEEPLAALTRDGGKLMEAHTTSVDEAPRDCWTKNLDLMQSLQDQGMLQIMVARSNGRVFGYLLTILGPSLEAPDRIVASHSAFYASPDFPGVGRKLQLAAQQVLKDRGVHEIIMRAGPRGDGPRLGAMYRRFGAEDYGQSFKLNLQE